MNAKQPLLQAFRQPWVLLSILILLLNDYILKNSAPSWLANRGQARQSKSNAAPAVPRKLAYAALALGAAASLAFTVTVYPAISSVQRILVDKTTLYASDYSSATASVYSSRDRGKTWTLEDNPSAEIFQALKIRLALPKTLCYPAKPQSCFHITVQQQVEESQDGGQTWNTAGQVPPERKSYMTRLVFMKLYSWVNFRFETPDYSPHAFDMVFLPGKGSSTLMVAMGKDGFLLHAPGKTWQYNPMTIVNPDGSVFYFPKSYPFQAASLSDAMSATLWEWLLAWLGGVAVYGLFIIIVFTRHRAGLTAQNLSYSLVINLGLASLVGLSIGLTFVAWAFGWIVSYDSAQATAADLGLISLVAGIIIQHSLLRDLTA